MVSRPYEYAKKYQIVHFKSIICELYFNKAFQKKGTRRQNHCRKEDRRNKKTKFNICQKMYRGIVKNCD